jgi:subfamily B ATP-binding cassette protein MsbA
MTALPKSDAPPSMNSKTLYVRLLHYALPYWRMFTLSLLSTIVVAATEPALPVLMKPLLDGSFVNRDQTTIILIPLAFVGLFFIRGMANFVSDYSTTWVSSRVVMDLRNSMFERLIAQPTAFYDNTAAGSIIANVAFNVMQVTSAGANVLTILVRDSVTIFGLLAWMLYLNWKLTLIAFVMGPLVALVVSLFSKRLRHTSRATQRTMGDIAHVLEETLDGHKRICLFHHRHAHAAGPD